MAIVGVVGVVIVLLIVGLLNGGGGGSSKTTERRSDSRGIKPARVKHETTTHGSSRRRERGEHSCGAVAAPRRAKCMCA